MPFEQMRLDKPINGRNGTFDRYFYRSEDDTLAQIRTSGYFSESRFRRTELENWIGGLIDVIGSDGYALFRVSGDGLSASVIGPSNGFFDYNDLATSTTPLSYTSGGADLIITNDGLGAFTSKAYAPSGVTDVWNTSTNLFDFSQLSLGDMLDIRLDIDVTTTSPNQEFSVFLELAVGGFSYTIPFDTLAPKQAGTTKVNRYNGIYMGDENTRSNGGRFKFSSDGNATVVVNGWYVRIDGKI